MEETEVIFLQVGDYGYFPQWHNPKALKSKDRWNQYGVKNKIDFIKDGYIKFFIAPGNHEDWEAISKFTDKFQEIQPYIYIADFGATLNLADNRIVMFCGGADSIDKAQRTPGKDWWSNEIITLSDMYKLPDHKEINVDIIISHTCPNYFDVKGSSQWSDDKAKDPSKDNLDTIFDMFNPSEWYFGHYHYRLQGTYNECTWHMLNMIGGYNGKFVTKI